MATFRIHLHYPACARVSSPFKMEDTKNHMSRYSANYHHHRHHHRHHQTHTPTSHRHNKHPSHITSYNQQVTADYTSDDDDSEEDEEEDELNQQNPEEEEFEYEEKYSKKRKFQTLSPNYEYTPRITPELPIVPQWTDHTTSILLDVWGDKIVQLGRKSLRAEEWTEVAKKVSHLARTARTDTQCRMRLDILKKKYKKEKAKDGSKWGHFRKMDMIISRRSEGLGLSLSCGLDSGEYVFMNSNVYLNFSNGMDEMRDSPDGSEAEDGENEALSSSSSGSSSFRMLADSIQKFGEIYQKIEESKREQMQELEKMRLEFHRDLELQKRQMLEQVQEEIEKLQERNGDDDRDDDEDGDEVDASAENPSE